MARRYDSLDRYLLVVSNNVNTTSRGMVLMDNNDKTMERVRALLTQAEHRNTSSEEAAAFTAKAAALMAKYGIDRALLTAQAPNSDTPDNRIVAIPNPWANEKAMLLYNLANALRCRAVGFPKQSGGARIHLFGYSSDLERTEVLYTSLLLQMTNALTKTKVPVDAPPRRYRRSWMLGFITEVTARVEQAELRATAEAEGVHEQSDDTSRSTALVLADRKQVIDRELTTKYPYTRTTRTSVTGSGYGVGQAAGQQADIGSTRVDSTNRHHIGGAR